VALMQENPLMRIQINGHTDNVGTASDNLVLSNNRSRAVINYLIKKGIAAQRLTAIGFGATKPVADNNTDDGRAKNRRTELQVLSK
jgi:outer membrane protein OmpA-like peptidoglycan-associated protein